MSHVSSHYWAPENRPTSFVDCPLGAGGDSAHRLFVTLSSPLEAPPVGLDVDDSQWETIPPNSYWGTWVTDFALRTRFQVPAEWDADRPVALYLPMGEAGDFSHPEVLAYIDGEPYAAADRHHHEILLSGRWRDGKPHLLALHGWTGLGGYESQKPVPTYAGMCRCADRRTDPRGRGSAVALIAQQLR
jgi:alpha-mannosidase